MNTQDTAPVNKEHATPILVVMAEPATSQVVGSALRFHNYETTHVATAADALEQVAHLHPSLIILDRELPDHDGLVACADLHALTSAPIILCGRKDRPSTPLLAFRLGAADFVTKPFDVDHLVARAEALLRRSDSPPAQSAPGPRIRPPVPAPHRPATPAPVNTPPAPIALARPTMPPTPSTPEATSVPVVVNERPRGDLRGSRKDTAPSGGQNPSTDPQPQQDQVGDLIVDHLHHRVAVDGHEVRLSRSEYLLLRSLASHPDEVLSRMDLAKAVWGPQLSRLGRPIDQHMYRLRSKLHRVADPLGLQIPAIVSVPGFGYKLVSDADDNQEIAS